MREPVTTTAPCVVTPGGWRFESPAVAWCGVVLAEYALVRKRTLVLSVATLTGTILLAGCASVYSDRVQGVPTEAADLALDLDQVDPPPFVVWAANGEDWLLVTWGSSSCPNAPASVAETAPGNFTIELEREGGPICTADMGPTLFARLVVSHS